MIITKTILGFNPPTKAIAHKMRWVPKEVGNKIEVGNKEFCSPTISIMKEWDAEGVPLAVL